MKNKLSSISYAVYVVGLSFCSLLVIHCKNGRTDDSVNYSNRQNEKKDSSASSGSASMDDAKFMVKSADGGMLEVQLGQIAEQRAVNNRVKNFGTMMVTDHTKANTDLKTLAASEHVTIPQTLSDDSQKKLNKLNALTGVDFDEAYMDMMVDDHNDDVSDFKKEAGESRNQAIQTFAIQTLPVLQIHLDSAKAIQNAVKDERKK